MSYWAIRNRQVMDAKRERDRQMCDQKTHFFQYRKPGEYFWNSYAEGPYHAEHRALPKFTVCEASVGGVKHKHDWFPKPSMIGELLAAATSHELLIAASRPLIPVRHKADWFPGGTTIIYRRSMASSVMPVDERYMR